MPIFRKKDGNVQEPNADDIATQVLDRQRQTADQYSESPTDLIDSEPPTVLGGAPTISPINTVFEEPKTVLIGANKRKQQKQEESINGMDDPIVGWVVIIKGPGQGKSRDLGYGQNSIGRGNNERVCLNFGSESDDEMSREKHAVITYDPKGKKYYLHSGTTTSLTYLNDSPVLVPVELNGGEEIILGQTHLRFVPFCGEDFDWNS